MKETWILRTSAELLRASYLDNAPFDLDRDVWRDTAALAVAELDGLNHRIAKLEGVVKAARLAWAVPNPTATKAGLMALTELGEALAALDAGGAK